jgi:hypothetical protein
MIHHTQTLTLLTEEFPELKGNVPVAQTDVRQLHTIVRAFAKLTQELIDLGDFSLVRSCFNLAEQLLSQGDTVLRNAMETSFLFTLHLEWSGYNNFAARQLLPPALRKSYYSMVNPDLAS